MLSKREVKALQDAFDEIGEVAGSRLREHDREIRKLTERVLKLERELETERRLRLGARRVK